VLRAPFTGYSEHTDRCYEESLKALQACGAILVEVQLPTAKELSESDAEMTILLHEFRAGLNRYLQRRTGLAVKSLADVIRWNRRHAAEEMGYFRQELLEQSEATKRSKPATYRKARQLALRLARVHGIDRVLREHRIQALVAPSQAPAFVIDQVDGDRWLGGATQPSAVAGYPIISVPAGWSFDLPLVLVFFAGSGSEARLLRFAYAFEQMTKARRPPRFLPTLKLP
jgi:amidase